MEEDILTADISASEDEDADDERRHIQLVDAISSLDGKRTKLGQRTVHSAQISEFHFGSTADDDKVMINELLGTLSSSVNHGGLKKQLRTMEKKSSTVQVPLPKHEKQQIERTVAYQSTKEDVSKWDPVVKENRMADQIIYPLQRQEVRLVTTDDFVKRFIPRTPLEQQVAALLQGSDCVPIKDQELTEAEEKALQAMDLDEAQERRRQLMKHRALMSYQEAKSKWRKKIKSKRFHRIMKKEKQKTDQKNIENLTTDPEAYNEKMDEMNKERIQERMTLKHRGGSKYAQKKMIYAKFDDKARKEVSEMQQKSRELTKKVAAGDESDDSEDGVSLDSEDEEQMLASQIQAEADGEKNPWLAGSEQKKKKKEKTKNPWMSGVPMSVEKNEFSRPKEVVNDDVEDEDVPDESDKDVLVAGDDSVMDEDGDDGSEKISKPVETDSAIDAIFDQGEGKKKKLQKKKEASKKRRELIKLKKKKLEESGENYTDKSAGKSKKSVNKRKSKGKSKNDSNTDSAIDLNMEDERGEETVMSESLTRKSTLEDVGKMSDYSSDEESSSVRKQNPKTVGAEKKTEPDTAEKKKKENDCIDPNKLFTMDSKIQRHSKSLDIIDNSDDGDDKDGDGEDMEEDEQQRMTIAEAFADDDVVEEFTREKGEVIEQDKPKDIDLNLPGWGQWGGTNIVPVKKKKFIIKAPIGPPRSDSKLGHVIINDKKLTKISKHQVKELPFPYMNVKQFEQTIRAPIGRTWNTETAFKELTKPKVITKQGKVIEPINKDECFKDKDEKEETDEEETKGKTGKKASKKRKRSSAGRKNKTKKKKSKTE